MIRKLFTCAAATLLLTLLLTPLSPQNAYAAQQNKAIVISPFLQEARIMASDKTKDVSVNLTNNTTAKQSFTVSVLDFGSLNDSGGIAFAGGNATTLNQKYGLASWLHVSNDHLTLAPGQTTKVQATIVNEATLAPGGHYAALVTTVDSPAAEGSDKISVKQKISALIFATKVGGELYDLRLTGTQYDGSWQRLPELVTLKFKNTGNVHVVPRGVVKLVSPSGSVVSQGIINEASAFVLPETSRQMLVQLQDIGRGGWKPGTYHLQVDYRYDGYDKFASKSIALRYFNVTGLVAAALGVVVLAYAGFKLRQKQLRKKPVDSPS